jgi:hypothetical protein
MIQRVGFLLIVLIGLAGVRSPLAQDPIWVTVEGTALVKSGDTKKARDQAVEIAERKAVAEALASGISVETLLVNLRLSGTIVGAIPFGKVVEKQILEEGPVNAQDGKSGSRDSLYRVCIKAGVMRETDGGDPSFNLDAAINQHVFKDGDELQISIRSTKACYFAIFNILEDNKIIRLLPNYLSRKNHLETGEEYVFPGTKDRKKGLKLLVHLPEKKDKVTESVYILALDHPFELKSIKVQEGIFGVFNGRTAFMTDLIREVVGIPLKNRAEALMQYEIRKNK